MRNLITPDAVAKAVLDLAEPEGPKNVTARALAGELNVSVGALYNYAGSMNQALDSAELVVLERLAEGLHADADRPLLTWIRANRGHAELLFELGRKHRDLPPEIREPLSAVIAPISSQEPLAAESVRNFLGMLISDPAGDATFADIDNWFEPLLGAFGDALRRHEKGESAATPVDSARLLEAAHAFIDEDADDAVRSAVRHETINILSEGSDRGWNFRALSGATGLPLARLHMFGTRHDHLTQVAVDLISAAMNLVDGDDRAKLTAVPSALASIPPSLFDGIIEVFTLTNLININARTGTFDMGEAVVEASGKPPLGLPRGFSSVGALSLLIAGFNRRDDDPEGWAASPNLAALFIDQALGT